MIQVRPTGMRGKIIAVTDIGSASAGLALISVRRRAPALVLAVERVVLAPEDRPAAATIAKLAEALQEAAARIAKQNLPSARELYCVMHAPWAHSESVSAYSRFENETTITNPLIDELAQKALANRKTVNASALIEASVVRVELNGYPTGAPVGKVARTISLVALMSDCDAQARTGIEKALENIFPQVKPTFSSITRALLSVVRERPDFGEDYLIVDIGSEATSLTVVRSSVVVRQESLQEGVRGILKRVAGAGMPEETLNLIGMVERDECSTGACEALRDAMARAEPDLVRVFGEGMAACAASSKLPNRLLLLCQSEIAPWLSRFFARIDFTQFTQTTQPFEVEVLSPKELERFALPDTGIMLDTGLALSTAFVNIEKNRE